MTPDWWLAHAAQLRLAAFLGVAGLLALAEWLWPRRGDAMDWRRRATNLSLVVVGAVLLRLAFPVVAVGAALWAQAQGFGLLHRLQPAPWLGFTAGVLLLDVALYWQHRIFHALPWLWRLHRVHHADIAFDFTTGVRFHPLELLLSMAIKIALVLLLGIPPLAVLVFEALLNAGAMFSHSNLRLPAVPDRWLRRLWVTPDMHRVHHSVHRDETDSNFGFHLSWWDHLFGSYRAQPRDGHLEMQIGLPRWRSRTEQTLRALLLHPFRSERAERAERAE